MKRNLILIFILSFVVASCGSKKSATDEVTLKSASAKKVIKHYHRTEPHFETIAANLRGSYDDGYGKQSISISLRMEKDEVIWMSAKFAGLIPMAKLMVTPDRVQFYEKVNNQYFDGDFSLLSKWLGTTIDFEKFQNLLLGKAIYDVDKGDYELSELEKGYLLVSDDGADIAKRLMVDRATFRLLSQQLISYSENQEILVSYPTYTRQNYFFFPAKIDIIVEKKEENTEINIDFRSFEINEPVRFPFSMPSNYKEIQIK